MDAVEKWSTGRKELISTQSREADDHRGVRRSDQERERHRQDVKAVPADGLQR